MSIACAIGVADVALGIKQHGRRRGELRAGEIRGALGATIVHDVLLQPGDYDLWLAPGAFSVRGGAYDTSALGLTSWTRRVAVSNVALP